jgi:hypothetical protein
MHFCRMQSGSSTWVVNTFFRALSILNATWAATATWPPIFKAKRVRPRLPV